MRYTTSREGRKTPSRWRSSSRARSVSAFVIRDPSPVPKARVVVTRPFVSLDPTRGCRHHTPAVLLSLCPLSVFREIRSYFEPSPERTRHPPTRHGRRRRRRWSHRLRAPEARARRPQPRVHGSPGRARSRQGRQLGKTDHGALEEEGQARAHRALAEVRAAPERQARARRIRGGRPTRRRRRGGRGRAARQAGHRPNRDRPRGGRERLGLRGCGFGGVEAVARGRPRADARAHVRGRRHAEGLTR